MAKIKAKADANLSLWLVYFRTEIAHWIGKGKSVRGEFIGLRQMPRLRPRLMLRPG